MLERVITYIYLGRENKAWKFYGRSYKLDDKEEISHVETILQRQPVYKVIYNHAAYK